MKKNKNQIYTYLAPIFISCQDKEILRSPGISSQMPWVPTPGTSCKLITEGFHIQVLDNDSPDVWEKIHLAIIPKKSLTPDIQTGILVLGCQEVHYTIPVKQAKSDWERISIVVIPNSFYQYLGPHIESQRFDLKYGEYYPADFKMRVKVKSDSMIPPTWIKED